MKLKLVWHHIQINRAKPEEKMMAKHLKVPYQTNSDPMILVIYSRVEHFKRLKEIYDDIELEGVEKKL